jgi:hypothetical protein
MPIVNSIPSDVSGIQMWLDLPDSRFKLIAEQDTGSAAHDITVNLTKIAGANGVGLYSAILRPNMYGTNPYTGENDTINSISDILLLNDEAHEVQFDGNTLGAMTIQTNR